MKCSGFQSGRRGLHSLAVIFLLTMWGSQSAWASDLWDRLRSDRYVLLMRHAYAPGVGDPTGYSLHRCETQRNLNPQGLVQAEGIGQWLRSQGVLSAQVYSSIWCRCQQTAERLKYGPVTIEPALASFFDQPQQASPQTRALEQLIARKLIDKGDRALILVTHHVNIEAYMGRAIGSGDMVLAQVTPQGRVIDFVIYPSP